MNHLFSRTLLATLLVVSPLSAALAQTQMSQSLSSNNGNQETVVDDIVAVVNDSVITRNELRLRVAEVERNLQKNGTPLPPVAVLDRQVLEHMIDERAELQQASDDGIRVDDFTVDRAVASLAAQNKLSLDAFRQKVQSEGVPFSSLRDDVRTEIIMQRLREREVDSTVQVSEGEIDNYLAQQSGLAADAQELDLAQILIRVPEQASADQIEAARAKAQDVYKQAQAGADFAKLTVSYSAAQDALDGGDMGWRVQERYPQLFLDAVKGLQPGQVAEPVKSPNGFHIIKLIGRRSALTASAMKVAPVLQTHARHILIRVNETTSADQARARLEEIRNRIIAGKATFEDMARTYSADGSAAKGGDLGNVFPGDTVPEFEHAMNALPIGGISQPVETQFGMHLIQVLGRSTQEIPQERLRLLARQAIHERKVEEAYQDWVRSVRDQAYVEVRLPEDHT